MDNATTNSFVHAEDQGSSLVHIELVERAGTPLQNRVTKTIEYSDPDLILSEHVLPNITSALKGFGFILDGKALAVVNEEDVEED